jgi:hypothetical protein
MGTPNRFKIPNRFRLLGQTIEVELQSNLVYDNDNGGEARYRGNKIALQQSTEGFPRLLSQIEGNFFHELIHWILYMMGWVDSEGVPLNDDEKFVRLVSGFLHQALTTMEYDN